MMPGRALIDFAIDQEGYFETSDPTIYDAPIIIKEGIIHYAVTNMSGVEFSNSSLRMTIATLSYALQLSISVGKQPLAKM